MAPTPPSALATRYSPRATLQLWFALACLALGEVFVFLRWPPWTDYYFILVWGGYILLADYVVYRRAGRSPMRDAPWRFLAMFPASSAIWWLFEGYNQVLHNWRYLGDEYDGLRYALTASLFFSTVLPAVWETAEVLLTYVGGDGDGGRRKAEGGRREAEGLGGWRGAKGGVPGGAVSPPSAFRLPPPWNWLPAVGAVLSVLPLLAPAQAFPLAWVGLFVLVDPLNARAGRPSILAMLLRGEWRVPAAFYLGTTITGFFWEFWNYWAWPKWVYTLSPAVESFPRLFEMPLPGYLGYGPFGWELFALWQLLLAVGGWLAWGARSRAMAPRASPSVPDRR